MAYHRKIFSLFKWTCNVMRVEKNDVEIKIRAKAKHLLDVDGDSCHHANNTAKKF